VRRVGRHEGKVQLERLAAPPPSQEGQKMKKRKI
jgi:hypothetical protein